MSAPPRPSGALDYLIIGGGLQGGLLATALHARRPDSRVMLVERASGLGGNHTWSFHDSDVPAASRKWVMSLVEASWPDQEVRFPGLTRVLPTGYHMISAERLDRRVRAIFAAAPHWELRLGADAQLLDDGRVEVPGREPVSARWVIDARGPGRCQAGAGYQKFVGLELALTRPAPTLRPLIMDATVAQDDGYRFMYVLPLSPTRVLLEDTYFSDRPELDAPRLRERILAYGAERGYAISEVIREEAGVLPMPWEAAEPNPLPRPGWFVAGYRGGFYHPATGYSLPIAVRIAELVATTPPDALAPALQDVYATHSSQRRFAHLLNWLAFVAIEPRSRWKVYEWVYRRFDERLLGRFYALALTHRDRARFMLGRPPGGMSVRQLWSRYGASKLVVDGGSVTPP